MWDREAAIAQMASSPRQRMGDLRDVEGPLHQRFGRQDRMAQILDPGGWKGARRPHFLGNPVPAGRCYVTGL